MSKDYEPRGKRKWAALAETFAMVVADRRRGALWIPKTAFLMAFTVQIDVDRG